MEAVEILIRKRRRLALDADRLLKRCGYEIDIQPHADRVFALDAEKGSRVFRERDPDLTSDEQQRIRSLISLHGRIADPGFILPGTLR